MNSLSASNAVKSSLYLFCLSALALSFSLRIADILISLILLSSSLTLVSCSSFLSKSSLLYLSSIFCTSKRYASFTPVKSFIPAFSNAAISSFNFCPLLNTSESLSVIVDK